MWVLQHIILGNQRGDSATEWCYFWGNIVYHPKTLEETIQSFTFASQRKTEGLPMLTVVTETCIKPFSHLSSKQLSDGLFSVLLNLQCTYSHDLPSPLSCRLAYFLFRIRASSPLRRGRKRKQMGLQVHNSFSWFGVKEVYQHTPVCSFQSSAEA